MFAGIAENTFYVFGALMFAYIPMVYCFLPETAGRTLETIDFLFASDSWFTWNEEEEYRKRVAEFDSQVGQSMGVKPRSEMDEMAVGGEKAEVTRQISAA